MENGPRNPGWDSQEIKRIAEEYFGGYAPMFEYHGWPERGSKMIPAVQKRVSESYGSVEAFVERYPPKNSETACNHTRNNVSDQIPDHRPELVRIIRSLAYACLILLGAIMSGGILIQGNSDGSYTINIFTGREVFSEFTFIAALVSVFLLVLLIFILLFLSMLYWNQRTRFTITSRKKNGDQNNVMK